jgi:hypothetical protein
VWVGLLRYAGQDQASYECRERKRSEVGELEREGSGLNDSLCFREAHWLAE